MPGSNFKDWEYSAPPSNIATVNSKQLNLNWGGECPSMTFETTTEWVPAPSFTCLQGKQLKHGFATSGAVEWAFSDRLKEAFGKSGLKLGSCAAIYSDPFTPLWRKQCKANEDSSLSGQVGFMLNQVSEWKALKQLVTNTQVVAAGAAKLPDR